MSSSLVDQLRSDMIAAMKAKEKTRLSVLRMLLSTAKDAAIEKGRELEDEELLRLIMSYAKKRDESIEGARKAGRDDLIEREQAELVVVRSYLPEPLSEVEIKQLVDEVVAELGAASMKDMGRVMKTLQERVQGRADGTRLSAAVKSRLAG